MVANYIILTFIHFIERFMNFHDFLTGIIFFTAVISFIYFYLLNNKMNKSIIDLTNEIEELSGTTDEKMVALNESINNKKNKEIKILWKKYYDTLLKNGSEGNSVDISTFFNRATLVDIPTKRKIAEIMPGTLIATGILGTFMGLVVGLNSMNLQNTEALQASMGSLLDGLKVGFLASVLAIGSSLIWNLLDRALLHRIAKSVTEFQVAFERIFPEESLGSYLIEMIKLQSAQNAAVENMKYNNIGGESQSSSGISDEKIYSKLTGAIAGAINKNMAPLTQSITELSSKLSESAKGSTQTSNTPSATSTSVATEAPVGSISQLVDKLDKTIDQLSKYENQVYSSIQELIDTLKTSTLNQNEINEKVNVISGSISDISTKIHDGVQSAVGSSIGQINQTVAASVKEMQNGIKNTFDDEIRGVTLHIDETLESVSATVEKTSKEFDDLKSSMKVLDTKLGDKVIYGAKTKRSDGEFY